MAKEGCSREQIQWRRGGACSSEGLEHVATNHGVGGSSPSSPKALKWKALDFSYGGRKVMIEIANAEFYNLGYSTEFDKRNETTLRRSSESYEVSLGLLLFIGWEQKLNSKR